MAWMPGSSPGMTRWEFGASHVLRPEAHADEPRWDPPEKRKAAEQRHHERRPRAGGHGQHVADNALLHEELDGLHHLGRPFAPRLHLGKEIDRRLTFTQR